MRIKFKDFTGLIESFFRNDASTPRTYQFPDKDITVAGISDITASQVGLGNVDNTSDANKPVSSATQSALDAKQATLVSGTNIKTINSTSLLGSGDISISGSVADGDKTGVQVSGSGSIWTLKKFGTIYDVTQYGLVGDGSTDNSSAITTLIAAVAEYSTFYFPIGDYKFVTSVAFTKSINIKGDGTWSRLITAADITLLNFDAGSTTPVSSVIIEDVSITNTKGSTPTSSSIGLRGEYAFGWHVSRVGFSGFYKNIQVLNVIDDVWDDITCVGWVNTGMEHINSSPYVDNGDGCISNSRFISDTYNSTYGIYHENGGGLKITNTKFNALANKMQYQYYYNANGTTVDILINNCSFENYSAGAIRVGESSGNIREVIITGNDIGATSTTGVTGITLSGVDIACITGNSLKGGSGSSTGISLTNCTNVTESGNTFDSWTTEVTTSGTTTFKRAVNSGGTLTLANDDILQVKSGVWTNRTIAQLITDLQAGGLSFDGYRSITGTDSVTSADYYKTIVCSGTSADYTVTLPTAVGISGKWFHFIGVVGLTKVVTIDGNSTETINGLLTRPFTKEGGFKIVSDGSNWVVQEERPSNIPYTPTWTGTSGQPSTNVGYFSLMGKMMTVSVACTATNTSGAGLTASIPSGYTCAIYKSNPANIQNAGTNSIGRMEIVATGTVITFYTGALAAIANTNGKLGEGTIVFEIQ